MAPRRHRPPVSRTTDPGRGWGGERPTLTSCGPPFQRSSWAFAPGDEVDSGVHAWACLGGGRRCETWLVWSDDHWSPAVAKVVRPEFVGDRPTRAALAAEAGRAGNLAHPAFQRLLGDRCDRPRPYVLFEYAEGPSLAGLLEQGPLPVDDVTLIGLQLASALHYLHGEGLVHLDLKPGNLVLRDGRVVVIDLGHARAVGHAPGHPLRGTRGYLAPEQAAGAPAAPSMDLYTVGVVLDELATGARRFPHPASSVHPAFDRCVARLLATDPRDRPVSAMALLTELVPVAAAVGSERLWPAWADQHLHRSS